MWKVTLKGLWSHKVRFLLTGVAVVLGVAFVAGTLVLSATIKSTFDGLFTDVYQNTGAVVRGQAAFKTDFGDARPNIPDSLIATVQDVPNVKAAGSIQILNVALTDKKGKVIEHNPGAPKLGSAWIPDPKLNVYKLAEGHAPRNAADVVIDKESFDSAKLRLGDRIVISSPKETPQKYTVVGAVRFGSQNTALGSTAAIFTLPTAQRLADQPGTVTDIEARSTNGESQAKLARRIRAALPTDANPKLQVVTGDAITKESQNSLDSILSIFNTFLLVFAIIALIVGAFLIFNTFSIIVQQRTREMALLRAIGANRRQVINSVLFESVLVGLIASVVGIVAGIFLSRGLKALIDAFGLTIPAGDTVVHANAIIVPLVLGLVVTVISAVFPAVKASRVPPIAAMRDVSIDESGTSKSRLFIGFGMLVGALAILFWGLFGGGGLPLVGVGVLFTFIAVAVLGPVLARPVANFIGAPAARFRGTPGSLARENAIRNPRRTSITAAALMIGVGIVAVLMVFVASFKSSFLGGIDRQVQATYVINTGSNGNGGFSPTIQDDLAAAPGVDGVTTFRYGFAKVGSHVTQAGAISVSDPKATKLFDPELTSGSRSLRDLGPTGIAIQKDTAKKNHWRIGSEVPVTFPTGGKQTFTVRSLYKDGSPFGSYFVSGAAFDQGSPDAPASYVLVETNGSEASKRSIEGVLKSYPSAKLQTREEFKRSVASQVDQILGLMYALLAMAIVIALFGISNTLGLSILERRRELGLLRAVGMTRRQLRSTVRWESVIISLFGTALGLVIGLGFGWVLVVSLKDQGIDRLVVPGAQIVLVVILAALAGVVAALLPARRAAKLDILTSIATE